MTTKTPLLLIGCLFGSTTAQLAEAFELEQIDDFYQPVGNRVDPSKLRCVAIGMVGSGHISRVAVDDEFLGQFPRLEVLACLGTGCEYVDMAAAEARGVVVSNTPGVNSEETADTAMGLLLGVVRQLPQADRYLRAGRWPDGMFPLTGTLRGQNVLAYWDWAASAKRWPTARWPSASKWPTTGAPPRTYLIHTTKAHSPWPKRRTF